MYVGFVEWGPLGEKVGGHTVAEKKGRTQRDPAQYHWIRKEDEQPKRGVSCVRCAEEEANNHWRVYK